MFDIPTHTDDDLVHDDEETFGPDHSRKGGSAAAAAKRAAAARSRDWREKQRKASEVDAAVVDAMVSIQIAGRSAQLREGSRGGDVVAMPVCLAMLTRLAHKRLLWKGWTALAAAEALKARLAPEHAPIAL